MTIGQMIRSLGLSETDAELERLRLLQDKARGGPPSAIPAAGSLSPTPHP
jgi:hypothetical protein